VKLKNTIKSILNSYSVIFFSEETLFALILITVSFFDVYSGICGLAAGITANITAELIGFDRFKIEKGYYSFNAVLFGVVMGMTLEFNAVVFFLVIIGAFMTLFAAVFLESILAKYSLPYLSLPFLVVFWIVSLGIRDVPLLVLSPREIYFVNFLYGLGGDSLLNVYYWWNGFVAAESLRTYFLSLGSIFFQHKIISGIFIAAGLLYFSRIAFSLSLIGFYAAYIFYPLVGIKLNELLFSYIGFNFVLVAIAVGGYFYIPSRKSYLWSVLLMPVIVLVSIAGIKVFTSLNLMVYSLPFNAVVIIFLLVIKARLYGQKGFEELSLQYGTPEENLYNYVNNNHRYKDNVYFSMRLPFFGDWVVSQGHKTNTTHRDKWQYAWDFVIRDAENKTYTNHGVKLEDYYCFNKAVLSPSSGIIEDIVDGIPDNTIGNVNLESNWGNSVVIKHAGGFYSQMNHLKPGSFKVSKGEWVKAGQVIAACGNSGRSPEPHLHFQFQTQPLIGAETVDYPFGYYLEKNNNTIYRSFNRPGMNDTVSNFEINTLMKNAFNFIPGQKIKFNVTVAGKRKQAEWEVITDVYNTSYLYCKTTNSRAYYANDDRVFYFYRFTGNKKCLLYYFFLLAYKVPLGFYEKLTVEDTVAVSYVYTKPGLFVQDFVAPFYIFMNADYKLVYTRKDDEINPGKLTLVSSVTKRFFNFNFKSLDFELTISRKGLCGILINAHGRKIEAECLNS
jgi:urea transporter/murein DD-endopeptidase MepM/ murein hydrolase activator NlpD